jgi:quercetin dioxygenase-like cupin family protein
MSAFLVGGLLALAQAASPPVVPMSAEPAHHLRFANADVAVYELVLPPGATTLYHAHPTPHLVVVLEPGTLRNEPVGQASAELATGQAGTVAYRPASSPHRLTNVGSSPVRLMAIELLKSESGGYPSAPPAVAGSHATDATPASGCAVALERAGVKAWRCRIGPGAPVAAHPGHGPHSWTEGAGPLLRVPVSAGILWSFDAKTHRQISQFELGSARWLPSYATTTFSTPGPEAVEFVDLEWPAP